MLQAHVNFNPNQLNGYRGRQGGANKEGVQGLWIKTQIGQVLCQIPSH